MLISGPRLHLATYRIHGMAATRALREDAGGHIMWMASSPIDTLLHFKEE
jgi:hypothetical protein